MFDFRKLAEETKEFEYYLVKAKFKLKSRVRIKDPPHFQFVLYNNELYARIKAKNIKEAANELHLWLHQNDLL